MISVAKAKGLISFAVTAKLICIFVFRICKLLVLSWGGSFVLNVKIYFCMHVTIYSALRVRFFLLKTVCV